MWYKLIIHIETDDSVKNQEHVRARVRSVLKNTKGIEQVGFIEMLKQGPSRKVRAPRAKTIERLHITKQEKCERFLKRIMAGRSVRASDVLQQGKKQGFGKRTMRRAKANLGIESRHVTGYWYWEMNN